VLDGKRRVKNVQHVSTIYNLFFFLLYEEKVSQKSEVRKSRKFVN